MTQFNTFIIEPNTYYRVKFRKEGDGACFWEICWSGPGGKNLFPFFQDWEIDWNNVITIQPIFRMDQSTGKIYRLNPDLISESRESLKEFYDDAI